MFRVQVNTSGFDKLADISGVWPEILEFWALRYRAYIRKEYDENSRGGGLWESLRTIRKRNKETGTTDPTSQIILRDTDTMFNALDADVTAAPGTVAELANTELTIGFGGPAAHPKGPTIAQLLTWHHSGDGVPERPILLDPTQAVLDDMAYFAEMKIGKHLG